MSDPHADLVRGEPSEVYGALRALLADLLVVADERTAPQLSKELRAVVEAQRQVRPVEASTSDDLAAARAARRAAAKAAQRPGGRDVNGGAGSG